MSKKSKIRWKGHNLPVSEIEKLQAGWNKKNKKAPESELEKLQAKWNKKNIKAPKRRNYKQKENKLKSLTLFNPIKIDWGSHIIEY